MQFRLDRSEANINYLKAALSKSLSLLSIVFSILTETYFLHTFRSSRANLNKATRTQQIDEDGFTSR